MGFFLKSFAPEKWVPFGAEYNALVIVDIRPLSGSGNPRDISKSVDRPSKSHKFSKVNCKSKDYLK